ncbi:esterase/lipase family protein [Spirochaeta cellobiosiphila]|uniref:esterase/lipase family protein n=1 Tax=Spirochaeta cellobiosiphila TaxID=504483 RepID=UPI0004110F4E|nr:alpha/beta fold hydrolase [Spirochaeta cellobiosiphila]
MNVKNVKIVLIVALILTFSISCSSIPDSASNSVDEDHITKYPIYVAHGLFERYDIPYPNFTVRITKYLKKNGYEVFYADTDSFGTIEDNAAKMKAQILAFLIDHPQYDKVNVIAYSKGGLETRYAISQLGMDSHIATLTMICTPNRGASSAEFLLTHWLFYNTAFELLVNAGGRAIGDTNPNYKEVIRSMTRKAMIQFNRDNPDSPKVKYYSFGADMTDHYFHIPLKFFWKVILDREGPNDGVVSIYSSKWGTYLGTVNDLMHTKKGITHIDVVGLGLLANREFDADLFILKIVRFLYEEGY